MLIKFNKQMTDTLKLLREKEAVYKTEKAFTMPEDVWAKVNAFEAGLDEIEQGKERFYCIGLTTANKIKYIDIVSTGTLNYNIVHPREVFRTAILAGVSSLIIAHNHPSNSVEPSPEDIALTKRLEEAGKILGIKILDHIITTKAGFSSFQEKGLL